MKTLLTTRELGERFHLSRPTIYRLIQTEGLPHMKLSRDIRFDQEAVTEWMAQKTLQAQAEVAAKMNEHPRLGRFNRQRPVTFALD